jgi:phosphoribosylformimino-5-aminoimidazole carboxamide ribotide isomerase
MKFRPCNDLHSGSVTQIVGSTLSDGSNPSLATNFSSPLPASHYARMYRDSGLAGGPVIMLGPGNDAAARAALAAYPGGLQVGGGVTAASAPLWLAQGASHVIVTSFVFKGGEVDYGNLGLLTGHPEVGKGRLVLDLSCRKLPAERVPEGADPDTYYVVTDRWQTYTSLAVTPASLKELAGHCAEFLVHGVENEGKRCGILDDLVELLASSPVPVTYAGGVAGMEDLERVKRLGGGRVDLTIGSALDIFGGGMSYEEVVRWHDKEQQEP